MKIIITSSFKKQFFKDFKNHNIEIETFVNKLKILKPIFLKYPFYKTKFDICWVSFRGIVVINDLWNMLPLFFVLKKDKKLWENIILDKETLIKINILFQRYSHDLDNWDYENM